MVDPMGICEKHELPLDGNGECELCRLSLMPSNAPPERSAWWALIIPLLILGAGIVWGLSTFGSEPEGSPQRGVQPVAPRPAGTAPVPAGPAPAEPDPAPPPAAPVTPQPSIPIEEIPVPDRSPEESPKGTQLDPPQTQPGPAKAEPVPDWKRDLARKRVTITMYATQWCEVCKRARNYMQANRIDFMELDTDENPVAKQRLEQLNPGQTIPTFQIDELVYVGFREELFEAKLDTASQKYL